MNRYFFHISYIGTRYRGSQRNLNYPNETIQGAIEAALSSVGSVNTPLTSFSSRTDKGVHALMNTFHVDLQHTKQGEVYQPHVLKKVVNAYMKENNHEILVTRASIVPESFHARFHAKWRSYLYRLAIVKPELRITYPETKKCDEFVPISLLNRCHIVQSNLSVSTVKETVNMFCGCHDFSAFTKYTLREPWKVTKRVIDEFEFYELPSYACCGESQFSNVTVWEFRVKSSGFLYHQVRKLVGTAIQVGLGNLTLLDVESLLKYPTPEKFCKVHLAPPCGLYLAYLHYDAEDFTATENTNIYKKFLEDT